jgi:hypothetical protein
MVNTSRMKCQTRLGQREAECSGEYTVYGVGARTWPPETGWSGESTVYISLGPVTEPSGDLTAFQIRAHSQDSCEGGARRRDVELSSVAGVAPARASRRSGLR